MKKFLIAVFMYIGLISTSYANDICLGYGQLAETIMKNRQGGIDIVTMLETLENSNYTNNLKTVTKALILMAYNHPEYTTLSIQEKTIRDFKTRIIIDCYEILTEKNKE